MASYSETFASGASTSGVSTSGISTSTRGGADYDEFCKGVVQYYSFNLCDLGGCREIRDVVRALYHQIDATTADLEVQSGKRIGRLYIGKTYVREKKKWKFDPKRSGTFKKTGIINRWKDHRIEVYGRDGMVVLGVITQR